MSNLETAKLMLKKAQELGDEELIQLALNLLEKDVVPDKQSVNFKYICEECGAEHKFDKPRKRCPSCKKHKLSEIIYSVKPEKKEIPKKESKRVSSLDDAIHIVSDRSKPRITVDEYGNERREMRRESIRADKNFGKQDISWMDSLIPVPEQQALEKEKEEGVAFMERATRRKPFKKKRKICEECKDEFFVAPALSQQYLCDRCAGSRRRR